MEKLISTAQLRFTNVSRKGAKAAKIKQSVYIFGLKRIKHKALNMKFENDLAKIIVGFRADIVVEDVLIIEIKAVEETDPLHFKQFLLI